MTPSSYDFVHGRELAWWSKQRRTRYVNTAYSYWRKLGFPYPHLSDLELFVQYHSFRNSSRPVFGQERRIGYSPLGIAVCNHFQPHMWSIRCTGFRSPIDVFEDDALFLDALHRAARMWKDRRPLSPANVRRMLATYKNTKRVSNFRPTVSRALIERYSGPGDLIVDPSAGYGGRMLGALPLNRRYVGIEPEPKTVDGLNTMLTFFTASDEVTAKVRIVQGAAEDKLANFKGGTVQLCIFCPPYYAREQYGNVPDQSYVRYPTYANWLIGFLDGVMRHVKRILKPGGFLCVNVANTEHHPVLDDTLKLAKRRFDYHYHYKMALGSVPYHRNGQRGGHRSEPLYVFRKR